MQTNFENGMNSIGEIPGRTLVSLNQHKMYHVVKRGMDLIIAFLTIVAVLPLMLITCICIKIEDPYGSILYNALRTGKNGQPFICKKFRSMRHDADSRKWMLLDANEMSGPVFKVHNDPRITKVGRFIRKYSIDELPQLFNVLSGEMSLVGPRPLIVEEAEQIPSRYRIRELVKPGITCIWQVSGRNEIDFEEWMKMDMVYISKQSLRLDLLLLLKTIPAVLSTRGAS